MNVDRMKYLGLVTAIAAAGCVITEKDNKDNDGGGGVGGTAGAGGTAGSGGEATGGSGGDATGGAGGAGGGTTCDDSVGTPAECTTLATDCVPYCNAAHQNLQIVRIRPGIDRIVPDLRVAFNADANVLPRFEPQSLPLKPQNRSRLCQLAGLQHLAGFPFIRCA